MGPWSTPETGRVPALILASRTFPMGGWQFPGLCSRYSANEDHPGPGEHCGSEWYRGAGQKRFLCPPRSKARNKQNLEVGAMGSGPGAPTVELGWGGLRPFGLSEGELELRSAVGTEQRVSGRLS